MRPNAPNFVKDNKNLTKLIKDSSNEKFIKGIIAYLKDYYTNNKIDKFLDSNADLIAFSDKVFDRTIGTFRDILPNDYISKTVGYNYINSNIEIRTRLTTIIEDIFMLNDQDEEGRKLANYYLIAKAHSLFQNKLESIYILVGDGRNGKSTIVETLEKRALGDYSYTAENTFITTHFRQGAPNPTLYECKGRRNLIVSEPAECDEFHKTTKINKEFIKQITGNDSITCRTLHKGNITYKPLFTPFVLCNKTPDIDLDKAMMKRLKVIPFRNTYVDDPFTIAGSKKIDYTLKDLLNSESYAREYLLMLIDTYITNKDENKVKPPLLVSGRTDEYFNDNNIVKRFLDAHVVREADSNISSTNLYGYYKQYCNTIGEQILTHKKFTLDMANNGYRPYKSNGIMIYKNISFINTD